MQTDPQAAGDWLSLSAAARVLNVHPTTLRRWADKGEVPVRLTPGGHRRFLRSELDRMAGRGEASVTVTVTAGPPATVAGEGEIGQAWADEAIVQTRREIPAQQGAAWMSALGEEERRRTRLLGQQLLALTLQFVSREEGEDPQALLDEASAMGVSYGSHCQAAGLSLRDALEASMFFRDTLVETAMQLPAQSSVTPEDNVRLLRRIHALLNRVHLSIAEAYGAG